MPHATMSNIFFTHVRVEWSTQRVYFNIISLEASMRNDVTLDEQLSGGGQLSLIHKAFFIFTLTSTKMWSPTLHPVLTLNVHARRMTI